MASAVILRSIEGSEFSLNLNRTYDTIDSIIKDCYDINNPIILQVPFKSSALNLMAKDYRRFSISQCCVMIVLMEYLGCYQVVEEIASRLLDIFKMNSKQPRRRVPREVQMAMGVIPGVGTRAVMAGIIPYQMLISPPEYLQVPLNDVDMYIRRFMASEYTCSQVMRLRILIGRLIRMKISPQIVIKSLHSLCYLYRLVSQFLEILIRLEAIDLLSYSLSNGYFRSIDNSIFLKVLYTSKNTRLIDVIMKQGRIPWISLFEAALNSPQEYPFKNLWFKPNEVDALNYLEKILIETPEDLSSRIQYLLSLDRKSVGNVTQFRMIILRELMFSSHHREARSILEASPECVTSFQSLMILDGEVYLDMILDCDRLDMETIKLVFRYNHQLRIDYNRLLIRHPIQILREVANHDRNLENLYTLMRQAHPADRNSVTIAKELFHHHSPEDLRETIPVIISYPVYYRALIPIRIIPLEWIWETLENNSTNLATPVLVEYIKILFRLSSHKQRQAYLNTSRLNMRSILLAI